MQFSIYICVLHLMKFFVSIVFIVVCSISIGQFHTAASRSELGVMVGGTFYMGDLNPYVPFRGTNLAGGIVYRYNVHSRLSIRANVIYGHLEGSDALSSNASRNNRNLSFYTDIYEGAVGVEFNYFPFQLGHDRYKGTAYLLAQLGMFRMNPKAETNAGEEVELRTLGTEGQGTSLSYKSAYGLNQVVIPIGVGAKLSLGKRVGMCLEAGFRKTFTDYIDDVGSSSFVDPILLAAENGPLAAEMSNRSLNGQRFGSRGDTSSKDWYFFAGGMITFQLGKPAKCFHQ